MQSGVAVWLQNWWNHKQSSNYFEIAASEMCSALLLSEDAVCLLASGLQRSLRRASFFFIKTINVLLCVC